MEKFTQFYGIVLTKVEERKMLSSLALAGLLAASPLNSAEAGSSHTSTVQPANTQKHLDTLVVSKTLYAEARGEGIQGMKAVATVIWNRSNGKSDRLAAVCKKPFQFSCWNGVKDIKVDDPIAFKESYAIAKTMIDGSFVPYTFKSVPRPVYYCTTELYKTNTPIHMKHKKAVQFGHHVFTGSQ